MNTIQKQIPIFFNQSVLSVRDVGVSRSTVRKYKNEYESKISKIKVSVESTTVDTLVEELSATPKYNPSSRAKRKLTDEIIENCLEKKL